jgi:hypothetical protein
MERIGDQFNPNKQHEFMDKNNKLDSENSGKRDNIFYINQKAVESVNRGKKICSIFFYIASAFDTFWHNGVIGKMLELNFPNYIVSGVTVFFRNRFFTVRVNK